MLRNGTAPEIIRRKGAEGTLPVALEEKIEVLVFLCGDGDPSIREAALRTLEGWNTGELQQVLSNPTVPPPVLEFVATHLAPAHKEIQQALLGNPNLPPNLRTETQNLVPESSGPLAGAAPASPPQPSDVGEPSDLGRETLLQKIAHMSAAEKIKLALTGSQEERLLLVRDANKIVARAVLQSPKLSDQEIESIASMKNVTEEVLRMVADNRKFMKSYPVVRALVNNPRAPLDSTLRLVNRLNDRDQKALSINKNVPDALRNMAEKLIRQKIEAQKVKLPGKH